MTNDADPSNEMLLDPALSPTAEGLWSEEESSAYDPSDSEQDEHPYKHRTNRFQPKVFTSLNMDWLQVRRRRIDKEPPPHIKSLLSKATSLYGSGDLQTARTTVNEIITLDNKSVQAYALLSHIYEDQGNMVEACNAVFIAATIAKRDEALWSHAGRMSTDLGFWQQAIKCYDEYCFLWIAWNWLRTIRLNPKDMNLLYERSALHAEHGSARRVRLVRGKN
jgi:tetratricopeptide (TPR) repeat protein